MECPPMNEDCVEQLLRELAKRLPPERLFSEETAQRIRNELRRLPETGGNESQRDPSQPDLPDDGSGTTSSL